MSPTIRIDGDVYAALQQRADAFVDTPNSVLRKILGLGKEADAEAGIALEPSAATRSTAARTKARRKPSEAKKQTRRRSRRKRKRALSASLLPESEYEIPLLAVLDELGGSAPAKDVIAGLGQKLDGTLTEADHARLKSGAVRWVNRAQFVRFKLVTAGDIRSDSERGVWEISPQGRQRLQEAHDDVR